jgi:prepilin-type N-terminal cleavage/methylation domain-containing protein
MRLLARPRWAGFSLVELLVVMAIILAISAMAVPQILNQIDIYRLRSASSAVVGVLQSARMQAVKDNKYYSVRGINAPATLGQANTPGVFVDSVGAGAAQGSGNNAYDNGETGAAIATRITFDLAGAHPVLPNALVGVNFAPQLVTTLPSFNSRGLPCVAAGAVCTGGIAGATTQFAFFLRQTGVTGVHWGAITVTGSGRMRTWTWTGTAWAGN